VTVSAKVRRELWVKFRSYGVNISEVISRSLEEELRRRETKPLKKLAAKTERNRDIILEEYEGELHVIESAEL